jgi:hypothetical protein
MLTMPPQVGHSQALFPSQSNKYIWPEGMHFEYHCSGKRAFHLYPPQFLLIDIVPVFYLRVKMACPSSTLATHQFL